MLYILNIVYICIVKFNEMVKKIKTKGLVIQISNEDSLKLEQKILDLKKINIQKKKSELASYYFHEGLIHNIEDQ